MTAVPLPQGTIFESNAIARYVGRMRRDTELYGVSFFESAQVRGFERAAEISMVEEAGVGYC